MPFLRRVACLLAVLLLHRRICFGYHSPLSSSFSRGRNCPVPRYKQTSNNIIQQHLGIFQNNHRALLSFENSSNESTNGNDESRGNIATSLWENFKSGALHVQNNFWNQFWYIYGRAALLGVIAPQIFLRLLFMLSPSLGMGILQVVTTTLLAVDSIVLPIKGLVLLMVFSLFLVPMKIIGVPLQGMTGSNVSINNIVFLLRIFIVSPIVEEVIFRRFLLVVLKRFLKKNNNKEDTQEKDGDNVAQASSTTAYYSSWAVVSSAIFALSHLSTYLGPLRSHVNKSFEQRLFLVNRAVVQFIVAFLLSLRVLVPTFEKNGLAASIGAHSVWNFSILTSKLGLTIRGMNRYLKWLRSKSSGDAKE